ncbi:DUF2529 domain-containing protein [Neobacillus fumarioli]|uniref:DUF2529 domain-containing protein n=1 Tax=Neobacillus fumarioli TaxID=105229 RepID=UPI0008367809|nr:DUF2529 domain-containing protein [Neobacillus fumarioli]
MIKMFATQLLGLFKKISETEEFSFEDGARLLAQAAIGDGAIYLWGSGEMKAIVFEALEGAEPLQQAKALTKANEAELTDADRVLLFSRTSKDPEAIALAERLRERMIPFVAVSTVHHTAGANSEAEEDLSELADVHIDLHLAKGLIPDDAGNRVGYPSSMAGLFVYYGLKFTIEEMLAEYEE